ncbi:MAG: aminotransferase class I/II-fold pyridoxal phosphate-dependent enzyme [Planctomycetota bacterium]
MNDLPPVLPDSSSPSGEESSHAEPLRQILHQAADQVADYLSSLESRPIFPASPTAPTGPLVPEEGENLSEVFTDSAQWAIENAVHVGHPGYVGHMDSGVAVAGILGDFLASALNQNLLAFELAPGATLLEKRLLRFFADEAGLPTTAGGIFTTGGTTANLTGLLLARDAANQSVTYTGLTSAPTLCVLASADAHYSIAKACAVLGLGSDQVCPVAVAGPQRRMDTNDLLRAFQQAQKDGKQPIAVVATAGTTSCGAVDPIPQIADFCQQHGLWLHVDAAHGGALLLHRKAKKRLAGIERADSITLDPHKWLYAPKSAGILLVRDEANLVTANYDAPYLDRFQEHGEAIPLSQGRRALDGSRRFDALKVWMTLRHFGRNGLEKILDGRLALSKELHLHLEQHPFFEPMHQPDLNVVVFRPRDAAHWPAIADAHRQLEAEGRFWTSYTRLDGQQCHRMVLINPATTAADLKQILDHLSVAHQTLWGNSSHPQHLSPKGRSEAPQALLHSSPDYRPKDGSHVAVGD